MARTILVVGAGSIGERHVRCFQQLGDIEIALCESNTDRRQEIADRYHVPQTFASLDEAAAESWTAAVVCTPAHLHAAHAIALAERTPALLIEKPLATRFEDALRLIDRLKDRVVSVAYPHRANPEVEAMTARLAAGEFGQPLQLTVVAGQHFPTFRPAYRDIYYAHRAMGGGAIQDAATHLFDLAQHLIGRFNWVFCDAAHQALPGVDVEDTVHVVARADSNRVMVSIALNQFMAPNEIVVQCNGLEGSCRLHLHEHRLAHLRPGDLTWTSTEPSIEHRDEVFIRQANHFLEAVSGQRPVACSLVDAAHTLQINLAALESSERREAVEIDLSLLPT